MSFGAFNPSRPQAMMSDINVTPMVDVMLVLLVIFMITAPLLTHRLALELPQAGAGSGASEQATLSIAIDAAGAVYVDDNKVTQSQLYLQLTAAAARSPQPEVLLRADKNTRYESVAQLMSAAQSRGLTKLGFVTKPDKENHNGQR